VSRRGLARHAAKRDANEAVIIDALEKQGFCVTQISGKGVPDLVVAKGRAFMRFVEIKSKTGTYTPAQVLWRSRWSGPPPITLRSVDDALRIMVLACASPTQDTPEGARA
jgi:hypothetical protein